VSPALFVVQFVVLVLVLVVDLWRFLNYSDRRF